MSPGPSARLPAPWRPRVVLAGLALLAVAVVLLARGLLPEGLVEDGFAGPLDAAGVWAYPIYLALYVLLTLTFLPTSPLAVAGGFLFGPLVGFACAWTGAFVGGAAAYALGRSGHRPFRDALLARVPPLARLLARHPFGAVLASRVLLMPYGPASYGLGLAGVRARDFLLGTGLGILPLVVAFVLFGAGFRDADAFLSPGFLIPLLAALVATALGAWLALRGSGQAQPLSREDGMPATSGDEEKPLPRRP